MAGCHVKAGHRERAVARHSHDPTARHWKAVLMIIEYLVGTKDLGLKFERESGLNLLVFADANYAEKADDRRSVSGVAVTLGNSVVSWVSSTQKIVTLWQNTWHSGMESKKRCSQSRCYLSSFRLCRTIASRCS